MFRHQNKLAVTLILIGLVAPAVARAQRGGGPDAEFPADREVFQWLLRNHHLIQREVTEIPDGVETRTESNDPEVADYIRRHVTAMVRRVETGRGIHYRDPLFAALFRHTGEIHVHVEPTQEGVLVRETGTSPASVQLIRAHAKVVSLFVERGFDEVHRNHAVPTARPFDAATGNHESPTPVSVFVEFDRVYIPALALTNQGQLAESRDALQRFRTMWASSQDDLQTALGDTLTWQTVSEAVRHALDAADRHLEDGAFKAAHESLEPIREVMTTARRAAGIDYPLDLLTDFHATMESIVKPAVEMSASTITPEYLEQLPLNLSKARLQWRRVESTGFSSVISTDRAPEMTAKIQAVRAALDRLTSAVKAADPVAILTAAQGLKPPFAQLYMSFGDFSSHREP